MEDQPLLVSRVINRLKREILNGTLPPGTRLPAERDLAEKYDVSRVTLRSAISRLAQLGFVKTVPQSGTFVNDYLNNASMDLLIDIMTSGDEVDSRFLAAMLDLRRIIEVHYTRNATLLMSEAGIEELRGLVEELGRTNIDSETLIHRVYQFHAQVIELSGNPILRFLLNSFKKVFRFYLKFYFQTPGSADSLKPHYESLLSAIEKRDEKYAAFIMGELLEHTELSVRKMLDTNASVSLD